MKTMTAIALYDLVGGEGPPACDGPRMGRSGLYVEWADGSRSWSPRYIFQNGYDQFLSVA